MIGATITKWPLPVRLILSPFLLLWYAIRVYLFPCVGITLRRGFRCCCRGFLRTFCCGMGLTFTDASFPANDNSIGHELLGKLANSGSIQWKRANVLIPEDETFYLFSKGVKAEDIKQGRVADCWLVAAMATLAGTMPGSIKKLFLNQERSLRGKYKIRLFDVSKDKWKTLTVDDLIPTSNGQPLFAQPNGNELWVVLLEKAIAKYCGSYSNIAHGFEAWGLKVLTGNHVFTFRRFLPTGKREKEQWRRFEFVPKPTVEDMRQSSSVSTEEVHESDAFWNVLLAYAQNRVGAMCCAIGGKEVEHTRKDGLVERHSYSIMRAVDLHGAKLIQLRNPWGSKGEWKGAWSDGSSKWNSSPLISGALGFKGKRNDGLFWMSWDDFRQVWDAITVCARSTDASDLVLDIHEDIGCLGPFVGCVRGCVGYWGLCRGCRHVICPVQSKERTRKGRTCVGCICCV